MKRISKRRRIESKTDYGKRMNMLKGETPRLVFRKSNRYIYSQYAESHEAQDKVIIQASSKELLKYGWPEKNKNIKNIPASYLTGYLIGKKIKKQKLKLPIIDFGMLRIIHKTKLFAFIRGVCDSGVEIKCSKENFPEEKRINGEHLRNKIPLAEIKLKIDKI